MENDKLIWIADLDGDVLVGFLQVRLSEAPNGFVEVPAECDLKTDGRYRWDAAEGRFEPIPEALLAIGDTAGFNAQVARAIVERTPRERLPVPVRRRIEFLEADNPNALAMIAQRARQKPRWRVPAGRRA